MPRVGVRELKNETSEIIRAVREDHVEYVVTHHGRPVAVILPVDEAWQEVETEYTVAAVQGSPDFWDRLAALRAEIAEKWQSDKTAVQLLEEQRR